MSTDLLELLKEARAGLLDHRGQCQVCANLIHSIDSALASSDKQAEETDLDERIFFLSADTEVQYAVSDGYETEVLKAGTYVWLARWTDEQIEAARRSAAELHRSLTQKQAEPVAIAEVKPSDATQYGKTVRLVYLDACIHLPIGDHELYAAPPDVVPRDLHDRLIREAKRNTFLEAARIVEHEAFPSELPRFRVATDVLRDRADEFDKEK